MSRHFLKFVFVLWTLRRSDLLDVCFAMHRIYACG
jgi:hypothetical protein